MFMLAGAPAGTFTSAYIFKYTGYYGIFITAYVLQVILVIKSDHTIQLSTYKLIYSLTFKIICPSSW